MTNLYVADCKLYLFGYHLIYKSTYTMKGWALIPVHSSNLMEAKDEIGEKLEADNYLKFYQFICDECIYDYDDFGKPPRTAENAHQTDFIVDEIALLEVLNVEVEDTQTRTTYTDPDNVVDVLSKFKAFNSYFARNPAP